MNNKLSLSFNASGFPNSYNTSHLLQRVEIAASRARGRVHEDLSDEIFNDDQVYKERLNEACHPRVLYLKESGMLSLSVQR
jgi:hypothetical protein